MEQHPPPSGQAERVIATVRVLLVLSVLFNTWLTPSHAPWSEQITYTILGIYLAYALILTLIAWRVHILLQGVMGITHVIDLAVFSLLLFLTEISPSAFTLYCVFALVCATLRWQWWGTLLTGLAALLVFIGAWTYSGRGLHDTDFELQHVIIGASCLALVTSLLGYAEAYRQQVYDIHSKLAVRPRAIFHEPAMLIRNVLTHAADLLQAPRVLMVWEEHEEPWVYLALWSLDEFSWTREPPTTFDHIVAQPLVDASFFCPDASASRPKVFYTSSKGLQRWRGMPLHPNLHKQFTIDAVLAFNLRGAAFDGHLFILDKPGLTADDLALGDLIARQVVADLDQFHLLQQRQQMAITEERIRLVRNLHDGLLQSLTGMALQLTETSRLQKEDPQAAQEHLVEVQRLLADEQRDLRCLVNELKSTSYDVVEAHLALATRLDAARRRLQSQWGLRVELTITLPEALIPVTLASEIYYIVHEALINVARHAYATVARAKLGIRNDRVQITVVDDGHGFTFRGHFTLEALAYRNLGPVMLRQRIAALRGTLTLESTATGSCLEITLPFAPTGKPEAPMSSFGA
ncbi:MAG TPA: sensor histidine kinase [Candidatus Tectomicrobia bacterium]